MKSHFEFRHHPKIPPSSAECPEQVVILFGVGTNHGTIRRDQRKSLDVVRRESVKASQPAKSSPKNQSGSPGVRHDAGRKSQTFFLRGSIDRPQQATAGEAASPRIRVDNDLPHSRQIDHHPVITSAEPSKTVPATTHGGEYSGARSR